MSDAMKPLIYAASEGPLSRAQAEMAFEELFNGTATPAQMGGLLMAMRARGESVSEYAAAAAVMRSKCNAVKAPEGAIDIVGTGGDGKGTLNISTATAFVVAGAGVTVAKHGNKNLSSLSGAADALSEMGINVMVGVDVVERAIAEAGIGFMMAPMHHPAIKHVMPVRQELGCKTIFNILGPLTNPAAVKRCWRLALRKHGLCMAVTALTSWQFPQPRKWPFWTMAKLRVLKFTQKMLACPCIRSAIFWAAHRPRMR